MMHSKHYSQHIIYFFIVITFIAYSISYSQWYEQGSPLDFDNYEIFSVNDSISCIISGAGRFLKTKDGGINWLQFSIYGRSLSLFFIDEEIGFVTSYEGIRKTIDSGESWETTTPYDALLQDIQFADDSVGYACGWEGRILKTIDQGVTWQLCTPDLPRDWPNTTFYSISVVNENVCYVFAEYDVGYRTNDGGKHWSEFKTNTGLHLVESFFLDEKTGYVIGGYLGSSLLKTKDGGESWEILCSTSEFLSSIYFTNYSIGYLGGGYVPGQSRPILWKTTDGGKTWNDQNPPTNISKAIYSIFFLNNCFGYAVGEDGLILKTINGGDSTTCYEDDKLIPEIILFQNRPNPFNTNTQITYFLRNEKQVTVDIYNILGQRVISLWNETTKYGEHTVQWDGRDRRGIAQSSGVYICRVSTKSFNDCIKVLYLK